MNEPGLHVEPDPELLELLKRQLDKDERLVWSGVPAAKAFLGAYRRLQFFGLGFCLFAFCLTGLAIVDAYSSKKSQVFLCLMVLMGLCFLAAGIWMTLGIEWNMRRMAIGTIYGITTKRVIVVEGSCEGGLPEMLKYSPAQLTRISRDARKDGSGDLVFEWIDSGYAWGGRGSRRPILRARGFVGVQNVHEVERLLRSTLQIP